MRKFMYAMLTLVVAFGLVRCGGGDDGPTDPDPDPDPNQSPTVSITSPAEGATFGAEEEVTFEGSAEDPEDGSLTGTSLVWSSDVDGELGTGETVTTTLTEGEHDVTLEATDSENASASASVGLTVEAAGGENQSPTVNITSPAEGATFDTEEEVTFEGSAEDPEDGALAGTSLVWTSDVDGELGNGESVTTTLTEGGHDVTLEATDSEGASASASVGVTVEAVGGGDIVNMTIIDNAFVDPDGNENANASITINLGQTVRWTYDSDGNATHTVDSGEGTGGDSGSGVPEGGTPISSGTLSPGDVYEFTPDAAGTWTYYCEIHPGIMYEAKIIVNQG